MFTRIQVTLLAVVATLLMMAPAAFASSYGQISQTSSIMPSLLVMQNAATANGNGTVMTVTGYATALLSVQGTFGATVNFEASSDGTTFVPILGNQVGASSIATSTTSTGDWQFNIAGYQQIRARVSGYASGNVTVNGFETVMHPPVGIVSISNTVSNNIAQVNGSTVGQTNGLPAMPVVQTKATYMACSSVYAIPATPTDMVVFTGSGSKKVKVLRVRLNCYQTTAAVEQFFLNKHSAADSGGTFFSETAIPLDSNDASATATLVHYSANPTGITSLGAITQPKLGVQTSATNFPAWTTLFDCNQFGKPIVLNSASEQVALNFNGAALPSGMQVQLEVLWTEE
jgi:hypothetical protein